MPRISKKQLEADARAKAEQQAREHAALRWTDDSDIKPDVPPPERWDALTTGWTVIPSARRVDVACSSSVNHAVGRIDEITSQHPRSLYSTRVRALRALRVALECEFAAELAKIDAQIERESSGAASS